MKLLRIHSVLTTLIIAGCLSSISSSAADSTHQNFDTWSWLSVCDVLAPYHKTSYTNPSDGWSVKYSFLHADDAAYFPDANLPLAYSTKNACWMQDYDLAPNAEIRSPLITNKIDGIAFMAASYAVGTNYFSVQYSTNGNDWITISNFQHTSQIWEPIGVYIEQSISNYYLRILKTGDTGNRVCGSLSGQILGIDSLAPGYVIQSSAGMGGSIYPQGSPLMPGGNESTFTITPDAEYHVYDVLVDGLSVGQVTEYTFTNLTSTGHWISASFQTNIYFTLDVFSQQGNPTPSGSSQQISNTIVNASAESLLTAGGTQYVCSGWIGTGSVPLSGTTNAVSFTFTNDSSLTWNWLTNYWLSTSESGGGTVDVENAWFSAGSNVVINADPLPGCSLITWTGDTGGCAVAGTQITVPMTGARTIGAEFNAPAISYGPSFIAVTGEVHCADMSDLISVTNSGFGTLDYTILSDAFWLIVSNETASLSAGMSTQHMVNISLFGLAAGSYSGHLIIDAPYTTNSPQSIDVVLVLHVGASSGAELWGQNDLNQCNIPPNTSNIVSISSGWDHSLALHENGTVTAWGWNNSGRLSVPVGLSNVIAVAAGGEHSLALKADGIVSGWGADGLSPSIPPGGLTNAVAIAAGYYHSLALKSDGTVEAWGVNGSGQITVPAGLTNVVAIAAGDYFSLALQPDGTVAGWGAVSVPEGLSNVVAIAAGGYHTLALKADGTVTGWGNNAYGQVNTPGGLSNVVAIAAGGYHSLALKADGTVAGWGNNAKGQVDMPAGLTNVVSLSAGQNFSTALGEPCRLDVQTSTYFAPGRHPYSPGTGTWERIKGTIIDASCAGVITGAVYTCDGWTGTGSVPLLGTATNISFTITNDTVLKWLFQTNHILTVSVGDHGTITPEGQVLIEHNTGTNFIITASNHYHITSIKTNNVLLSVYSYGNALTNVLYTWTNAGWYDYSISATFGANMCSNSTPEPWLSIYYPDTNDFDNAAVSDTDKDGYKAWEEYVAGTVPTNRDDVFKISDSALTNISDFVIYWNSITGRLYSVYSKTNLMSLLWTTNLYQSPGISGTMSYTNYDGAAGKYFYIDVELP